jgi:aspartate/methionine/tyrosine aminotransferase
MALQMTPPREGDPSYELYRSERDGVLASLKRRAVMLTNALNQIEGMSCNAAEGAMYAFPKCVPSPDPASPPALFLSSLYCIFEPLN